MTATPKTVGALHWRDDHGRCGCYAEPRHHDCAVAEVRRLHALLDGANDGDEGADRPETVLVAAQTAAAYAQAEVARATEMASSVRARQWSQHLAVAESVMRVTQELVRERAARAALEAELARLRPLAGFLAAPIEDGISDAPSVRLCFELSRAGVRTMRDLLAATPAELLRAAVSRKRLIELVGHLERMGLSLRDDDGSWR